MEVVLLRQLLRRLCVLFLVAVAASLPSVHAAWGDVSYDPNPARIDEDQAAQFAAFGLLTDVGSPSLGGTSARQDFASGFVNARALTDWVKLGDNRVRCGPGDSLQRLDWRSRIGQIDPGATACGLFHPRGTYGNAAGVSGEPLNDMPDHSFLNADSVAGTAKPCLVMQFERPIVCVGLSISNHSSDVGGRSRFDLTGGGAAGPRCAKPVASSQDSASTSVSAWACATRVLQRLHFNTAVPWPSRGRLLSAAAGRPASC